MTVPLVPVTTGPGKTAVGSKVTHRPSLVCVTHRTFALSEGGGESFGSFCERGEGKEEITSCLFPAPLVGNSERSLGREGVGQEANRYFWEKTGTSEAWSQ